MYDAQHPDRNIVGMPVVSDEYEEKAKFVLSVLPKAPYEKVCTSREAELVKYIGNSFLTTRVVFINMMYDLAQSLGANWDVVAEVFSNDPRIGKSHINPIHQSGRGAGGHCFPKDFEALLHFYEKQLSDPNGNALLTSIRNKNLQLLKESGKDLDILKGIYEA